MQEASLLGPSLPAKSMHNTQTMPLSINVGLPSQVFIDFFKFGDLKKQSM